MKVCFDGIGKEVMTFTVNGTSPAAAGCGVVLSGNGEVKAASANGAFAGICLDTGDGFASVQLRGVVTCKFSGSKAPTVGFCKLAAAADGVTAAVTGNSYLVLAVDNGAGTVTFMM